MELNGFTAFFLFFSFSPGSSGHLDRIPPFHFLEALLLHFCHFLKLVTTTRSFYVSVFIAIPIPNNSTSLLSNYKVYKIALA